MNLKKEIRSGFSFASGIIPYFFRNINNASRYLSLCNTFAGGVFFGAGLLHLFADANSELEKYNLKYNYPLSTLCLCFGFLFTLFLELVVNEVLSKYEKNSQNTEYFETIREEDPISPKTNKNINNSETQKILLIHSHDQKPKSKNSLVIPILLVVALSIHSLFEGLAMGVQTSQLLVIDILIAIFSHKLLASFALGVSIITNSPNGNVSIYKLSILIFIFSLSSPIGSIIGLLIVGVAGSITPPILQGIASGTFLYISMVEIIPKELNHQSRDIIWKSILLLLGFGGMAIVAIWV
ncbi:zinc/iron permease [Tieghemostelium lacteum]|uniref:Zinc/iron permease n=1 Tax=Tieghemostelium lacteum TaxID=361077 RepID=A0A152A3E6_TIELA|nr:zinc/iron permease [Tieghemostelium lacteum]|eukprot:KYR00571.1 zinc/iron permease [Tieghemostelium lacteum]